MTEQRRIEEQRMTLDAMARQYLAVFVRQAFPILHPGRLIVPSWHIDAICWYAQRIVDGSAPPRCIFNLPPRSLKTFILSICVPAWLLGRDASTRIICVSYGEELAKKFSRECRALMQSSFYRRLFPETELSPQKSTEIEFETTARGYRLATSIGGTLTGRGGEWLIIDDPHKAEEGWSERPRTAVTEWFKHSARSRLDNQREDKIILVMQRLHQEDLSGILVQSAWPVLAIPAIATETRCYETGPGETCWVNVGDVLQPAINDRAALDAIKADIGHQAFEAEYQQIPLPEDGDYVRREYFPRTEGPGPGEFVRRVMSVDPAAKKSARNDYTAITLWAANLKAFHLLHARRGRWNVRETVAHIVTLAEEYGINEIIVEDTSSGTAVIELLKEKRMSISVLGKSPKEEKLIRLMRQLGKIESGKVTLPKDADWAEDFLTEVVNFPNARYDDYVDSLVQFLEWTGAEGTVWLMEPVAPISILKEPHERWPK